MNKTIFSLLALALVAICPTMAQDTKNAKDKSEKKEITIEEKSSGKNEKMVIIVDGDKVTINGKPADEYKGNKHFVIDDDIVINGDEVHIPRNGRMYMRGFANRAMLGVVTDKTDKGAVVKEVVKESPAEKAGIQKGDVIRKVNSKEITPSNDLVKTIGELKPGEQADIVLLRDGKEKKIKATLGKSDAPMAMAWNMDPNHFNYNFHFDPPMAMAGPRPPRPFRNDNDMWIFRSDRPKYGMSIEDNADGDGVKITNLDSAGNAMKGGLKEGDIITEVEGKTVKGTEELKDILGDIEDKSSINMKVLRNGSAQNLTIRVPKEIRKADL